MQQTITLLATLTKIHKQQLTRDVNTTKFECQLNGCFTNCYVQNGLLFQSRDIKGECGTKKGKHQCYCCKQCYIRRFI